MTGAASLPIRLILDRLLYASDASDARSSLGQLQERIRRRSSSSSTDEQQRDSEVLELAGEHTFVSILCQLILNSQLFGNDEETVGEVQKSPIDLEDGSILACDLLLNLLASSSTEEEEENNLKSSKPRTSVEYIAAKALLSPSLSTGSTSSTVAADVVSSLVDVLTNKTASSHTTYERILSVKLLSRLFTLQPSMTQFSLIHRTPHGLNRLVDLLDVAEEERIRNEILILLITALSKSTSANTFRQMLLFAEGIDKALQIAVTSEDVGGCGGLSTKINEVVILDCTTLIFSILQMGGAAPDILLGSPSSLRALTQLCDGRKGKQFLYKDYSVTNTAENSKLQRSAPAHQHLSMEDLLSSNVTPTLSLLPSNTSSLTGAILFTPTLTKYEDLIVTSCLKILLFCISSQEEEDIDQVQWKKIISRRNIVAGNWELIGIIKCWAFYQPPPCSPRAFVACSPREATQKVALQILSTLCSRTNSDTTTLPLQKQQDTINTICDLVERPPPIYNPNTTTDNYFNHPITYKLLDLTLNHPSLVIMAAAISTLRSCLTEEQATIMVLHALAPPPPSPEEEEAGPVVLPISPVQTLVDELANNLLSSHDEPFQIKSTHITRVIQGSAAALGVILHVGGKACKEMLLKIPISVSEVNNEQKNNALRSQFLLPTIASWLEKCSKSKENIDTAVVSIRSSLIRLICDWSNNCHKVVADGIFSSLSNPISMVNFLLTEQRDGQNLTEIGLAALLLGLWMENIGDAEQAGWSRSVLLNIVQGKIGLSSFTEILESAKEELHSKKFAFSDNLKSNPFWWSCYEQEQRYMYDWFLKNVNVVRRRLVHEITGIGERPETVNDDGIVSDNYPFLSTLVKQQDAEIESLRRSLREASINLTLTTSECRQWRARCESSSFSDADAITEQIEVAIKAQQEVIALREELYSKDNLLSNVKNEKDAAEQNFQSRLNFLQRENDTIAQENKSMSQELQSLSQAYYNLEEEIRLMKSKCSVESHQELVGEDQSLAKFRYDVVSSDSPGEIEALQREVQNLRERLHAADDWMAMAVDRMNAMALENVSLVSNLRQNRNQVQVNDTSQQTTDELSSSIYSDSHLIADMKPEEHILEEGVEVLNHVKVEKHILEEEVELLKHENVKAQEWMSQALASNRFLTQQNEEFSIQIDALNGRIRTLEEEMLDVMSDKKRAVDELKVELESTKSELQTMKGSLENAYSVTELREDIPNSMQKENVVHNVISDAFAHHNVADNQIEILKCNIREREEQLLVAIQEKENIIKKLAQAENEVALLKAKLEASLHVSGTGSPKAELQEEILKLRKSNVEAQEWMSNAVLHHEYLNGELGSLRLSMANLTKSDDQLRTQMHELASRNTALMEDVSALKYEKENFIKELKEVTDADEGEIAESLHDFKGCISLVKGMKKKLLHDMDLITAKLEVASLSYTEASGVVDELKEQIYQYKRELDLYRAEGRHKTNSMRVLDFEDERDFQFSSVEHHGVALGVEIKNSCLQEQIKDLEDKLITSNTQIELLLESERSAKMASLAATEEVTNARIECTRMSNELHISKEALAESKKKLAAMEELLEKKKADLEEEEQKIEALYHEKSLLRDKFDKCQNSNNNLVVKLETETKKFEESRNEVRALEERLSLEVKMRIANENSISSLTESIQGYQESLEKKQVELDRFRNEWEEDITASKNLVAESKGIRVQNKLLAKCDTP